MQSFAIIVLCILFSVGYGILHDQITARVCVEYFTIGHPPMFDTADPTLLGLGWGIVATWWVGLIMGLPLAVAARLGKRPKRSAASLIGPLAALMASAGLCALLAGLTGWALAASGSVFLVGDLAQKIPADRQVPFLADAFAHSASYLVGFFGGIVLIAWVRWARGRALAAERLA